MMGANAGLHPDKAARQIGKAVLKLAARKLCLQDDGAALVEADQVKDILADIDADDGNALGLAVFLFAGTGSSSVPVIPPCNRWEGNRRSTPLAGDSWEHRRRTIGPTA
jgi:hypothetical protein